MSQAPNIGAEVWAIEHPWTSLAALTAAFPPASTKPGASTYVTGVGDVSNSGAAWLPSIGGSFNQVCTYALPAGTTHDLGPSPTTGTFTAGVTNVFVVTPNAGGSSIDSITAGPNVILLYNSSLTLSLSILDTNNSGTSGTAANRIAVPNPNGLAANSIVATLAPQSGQKLTYISNQWICA